MFLENLRQHEGIFDYISEGFWHTDPESIVGWVKGNYKDFTKAEEKQIFGRVYSGLGNLFHSFELDAQGQVKYFCRCGRAIDRQYNVNFARRYLSPEEMIRSMEEHEAKLSSFEMMRMADLEFNLKVLREEENKEKKEKTKKTSKESKQLKKLRRVGGVVEFVANELQFSNPENVANWIKENYDHLTNEEKKEIMGTVFVGAGSSYHKFELDANNQFKHISKTAEAIDKEFFSKHSDGNIDAIEQIEAMEQNANELSDFENARLNDLRVKQCSVTESVLNGENVVLQSAVTVIGDDAQTSQSDEENTRREGYALDYVAEGLWHTNPESIASWVSENAQNFSEKEKSQIFGKVFEGLGGMYHKYELDEQGQFHYTCRTKNEIDREYNANHASSNLTFEQQFSSMDENKETLNDFERKRLSDLRGDIERGQQKSEAKISPAERKF